MSDTTFNPDQGGAGFNRKPDEPNPDDGGRVDEDSFVEIEGRKFTKEDVIKKIQHADTHISRLEGEQKDYRDTLDKLMDQVERIPKLEEALERAMYNKDGTEKTQEINLDEVIEAAKKESLSAVEQQRLEETYNNNIQSVAERLQEEFGEDPDKEVFNRAAEVGYTREQAFDLAGRNPKAFYRLIGLENRKVEKDPKPTSSDIRTPNITDGDPDKPRRNIMEARTTKERIAIFDERLAEKRKELGLD